MDGCVLWSSLEIPGRSIYLVDWNFWHLLAASLETVGEPNLVFDPFSAVDAFVYVWEMLDQHWAKTIYWHVNASEMPLILNLLKLFLSYICDLAHPCQSVPIDSAPRASQAKKRQTLPCAAAGDATYAIGFGPCRIFAAVFSVRENSKIERSHGGNDHEERRVFWGSRILDYSWIFLYSHSHAWIMSRRNRICPACTQTVSPCHGKDHYDYENDTKWSFVFCFYASDISWHSL